MPATSPGSERRTSARRRTCLGGSLRVAAFLPEIDCRLRDVSLGGAHIVVSECESLPAHVELTVPCRGETRTARLVWRCGDRAGLRFLDGPDARLGNGGETAVEEASPPTRYRLH